jgi:hypothetical protein
MQLKREKRKEKKRKRELREGDWSVATAIVVRVLYFRLGANLPTSTDAS